MCVWSHRAIPLYWSLFLWVMKEACGRPMARDLAQLALPRNPNVRLWFAAKVKEGVIPLNIVMHCQSASRRRKLLKETKRAFLPEVRKLKAQPWVQEFKTGLQAGASQFENQPQDAESTPLATRLYPELDCDWHTAMQEPWRVKKAFPPTILNSSREAQRLFRELPQGKHSYGDQLNTLLWQVAVKPSSLNLPAIRSNDPLLELMGFVPGSNPTGHEAARAITRLLESFNEEQQAKQLMDNQMARVLRHEFGLSRDRKTSSFSNTSEGRKGSRKRRFKKADAEIQWSDPVALHGYEDVDDRLTYEAIRDTLPPAQRTALERYRESRELGETLDAVCRKYGDKPVTVRNNFQAAKRKLRQQQQA